MMDADGAQIGGTLEVGVGAGTGYPLDRLFEEIAFIAYHFHWSHDEVLDLPHWERRRWCEEISRINERHNEANG